MTYLKSDLFFRRVGNGQGRHGTTARVRHTEYQSILRPVTSTEPLTL